MTIDELKAEIQGLASTAKSKGMHDIALGLVTAMCTIEDNRAGFDKAQDLADLVPGLVEALEWGTNASPTGEIRNEMTERIIKARQLMEDVDGG